MSENQDKLVVVGIGSEGYGNSYKLVMLDVRLSIEAKGIYNYFSSYAGAGSTAFPKVETILYHLRLSKERYYDHLFLLTYYGYLRIEQVKEKSGVFKHNIYYLLQEVGKPENPTPYKRGDEKKLKKEAKSDTNTEPFPCNPTTVKPNTDNQDNNNNSINKNNLNTLNKEIDNIDDDKRTSSHNEETINLIISNFKEATKDELSGRSFKAVVRKVIDKYNQGKVNSFRDYLATALSNKICDLELRRAKDKAKIELLGSKVQRAQKRAHELEQTPITRNIPFYNWLEEY